MKILSLSVFIVLLFISTSLCQTTVYSGTITASSTYDAYSTNNLPFTCDVPCITNGNADCDAGFIGSVVAYTIINDGNGHTYYLDISASTWKTLPAGVPDLTYGVHVYTGNTYTGLIPISGPIGFVISETFLFGYNPISVNIYNGLSLLTTGLPMAPGATDYTLYARIPAASVDREFILFPAYTSFATFQANVEANSYGSAVWYVLAQPGPSTSCATDPLPVFLPPTTIPLTTTTTPTTIEPTTVAPTTIQPTTCVPSGCNLASCGQLIEDGCGHSIQCPSCPTGSCSLVGSTVRCNALPTGQALVSNTTGSTLVSIFSVSFSLVSGKSTYLSVTYTYSVNGSMSTLVSNIKLNNAQYVDSFNALLNHSSSEISFITPIKYAGSVSDTIIVNLTLSNVELSVKKRQSSSISADILLGLCFAKLPGKSGLQHGNSHNQSGLDNRSLNVSCSTSAVVSYNSPIGISVSSLIDIAQNLLSESFSNTITSSIGLMFVILFLVF